MDPSWPPSTDEAALLTRLASVLERAGPSRLLDAPIVAADARAFPDPWWPTVAALEQLLRRLLWHAHVDLDVALEDLRHPYAGPAAKSVVDWRGTVDGVAQFRVTALGNDDIAGLLTHQLGCAFAASLDTGALYRDARRPEVTLRDGSIAAVYLGLGVLATNAAVHLVIDNTQEVELGKIRPPKVILNGGLTTSEACYLLAVQAVARGGEVAALATLRFDLRRHVAHAIAALQPHRAALLDRLGLDLAAARPPLERAPAPPPVTGADRPAPAPPRGRRFWGVRSYRLQRSRASEHGLLGFAAGAATSAALAIAHLTPLAPVVAAVTVGAMTIGALHGLRRRVARCIRCGGELPAAATACPACGASIVGTVTSMHELRALELDRLD
jgi:hypothetical protein